MSKNPAWSWFIVSYFFVGGIAAGAYVLAAAADFAGRHGNRRVARAGYGIAVPLVLICPILLSLDLGVPVRTFNMFRAFTFGSPMSVGSWALGGEYSYRRNAPIQGTDFLSVAASGADLAGNVVAPGTKYVGFERYKRHQIQMTAQRLWGPMPMFRADQWNTIGEIAYGWIDDVPGLDVDGHERVGYSPAQLGAFSAAGGGFLRFDDVTRDFWGFQARSTLTYNNILFNRINMDFNTAFRWDVEGVSPEFGGATLFIGGRKQLSVGVTFDYALNWKVGINQTFIFDGDNDQWRPARSRPVNNTDRDFLSLDVSYTF